MSAPSEGCIDPRGTDVMSNPSSSRHAATWARVGRPAGEPETSGPAAATPHPKSVAGGGAEQHMPRRGDAPAQDDGGEEIVRKPGSQVHGAEREEHDDRLAEA